MTASGFVTYDPEADALYVYLMPPDTDVDQTRLLDMNRSMDLDDQGQVIGIEFLDASHGIDLTGVPETERVTEAIRSLQQLTPA